MATPFPPSDHRISLEQAVAIARNYRNAGVTSRWPIFGFSRQALDDMLGQGGCAGIRIYPAQHDDGSLTVVLVGVDEGGSDMTQGVLAQVPWDCPPYCDEASPLFVG
jgi:hypothetical protein